MNQITKTSLVAALLASASIGAFAAETADLTVKGVIKPAACDITLSGGAIVDFGNIPANTLSDTGFTNVGNKRFDIVVSCDAATKFGLSAVDNRAGTVPTGIGSFLVGNQTDTAVYGAGEDSGKKIGGYLIARTGEPTVDGATGSLLVSDNGGPWAFASSGWGAMAPTRVQSPSLSGSSVPGQFKTFTQSYEVWLAVNKKADLPSLTKDINIDGMATFTLKYL